MHNPFRPFHQNRLLALLPENEIQPIAPVIELVSLERGTVLVGADQQIEYAYFLCSGIGSVLTVSPDGQRSEAGMFGREGFSPTSAGVGGTVSIHEVRIQVEGEAYRIAIDDMTDILPQNPVFSNLLARFIQTFASQISFTALCNANYQIDERLARWLLMCHDRVDGDEITLTHDFISSMIAVRRPSVTNAIHILEGKKFIRAERGRITIRDRRGLEAFAADIYGKAEAEYQSLIGAL